MNVRRAIVKLLLAVCMAMIMPAASVMGQTGTSFPLVTTEVQPTSGTIGDKFHLLISATVPGNVNSLQVLEMFDLQTTWTEIDKTVSDKTASPSGQTRTWDYTLMPFETGRQDVPQVAVTWTAADGTSHTVQSQSLWVQINSVLSGDGSASALRQVKPPLPMPVPKGLIWSGSLIILLLIAVLAWWLWRRYSMRLKRMIGRALTPPEIALRDLNSLESERLVEHKKIKEFYTRLADTLRQYLHKAYGVQAMDLTTNELLNELDEIAETESPRHMDSYRKAVARLAELLNEGDMVKFARYVPEPSQCRRALQGARDIVQITRYRFETEPDSEAEKSSTGTSSAAPPPLPVSSQTPNATAASRPSNPDTPSRGSRL